MNYFKSDAVKAVREASISIACLCADWTEHFEGITENADLQKDLDHIQDQITILENHLDPYIPDDNSKLATPQQQTA